MKILREAYTRPLTSEEGENLTHLEWNKLLFHLNKFMQKGALMDNYAIKKLQELVITQVNDQRSLSVKRTFSAKYGPSND